MDLATLPTPSDSEAAEHVATAKRRAAVALDHVVFELHKRALLPNTTTAHLLGIAEHMQKVSGASAKQEAPAGPRFSITINIPPLGGAPAQQVVLTRVEDDELPPVPAARPAALSLFTVSDDLSVDDLDPPGD